MMEDEDQTVGELLPTIHHNQDWHRRLIIYNTLPVTIKKNNYILLTNRLFLQMIHEWVAVLIRIYCI